MHGGIYRLVFYLNAVVALVTVAQAFQNLHRFLFRGFANLDRLEATLKSCVPLDVLAELILSRRAYALKLPSRKGRLHDVRSINRAFCGACTYERVELIHKQNDLAICSADFFHDALHPLLKLAAVLRTGDKSCEV